MSESGYRLNSTKSYHTGRLSTLGWELTVCNALYPPGTPVRKLLRRDDSFGHLLYDYLNGIFDMGKVRRIVEVGGGYGYLMRDFLSRNGALQPVMIDLSPVLLDRQREALRGREVHYREEDFLETDAALLKDFDLAVLNENLGDFPTLVNVEATILLGAAGDSPVLQRARNLIERYGLDVPADRPFHFNLGAVEAIEKLCSAGVPVIYAGEHSCEAAAPADLGGLLRLESAGWPERVPLMGHDEYTIRFSHLAAVADALGYRIIRGPFADFIRLRVTDGLKRILATGGRLSDTDEVVFQFVGDLFKYEYLILQNTAFRAPEGT